MGNNLSVEPGSVDSGFIAKYDWFVLKPLSICLDIMAIIFFINRQWWDGILFIFIGFLIGVIAQSLHKDKTPAELAAGYPKLDEALKKEINLPVGEEKTLLKKAKINLRIILGTTFLILSFFHQIPWRFAVLFSFVMAWLMPIASYWIVTFCFYFSKKERL